MQAKVLAMVLAGGKGTRLHPLTKERSKPAVPFGGKYRIVDFVLSNLINSGIYSIYVLTQFKAQSLLQHLRDGWQFGQVLKEQFIIPVPAQMRQGERWYEGTSDAIYQNMHLIELASPDLVAIFGADHVYRMDVTQMMAFHDEKGAKGNGCRALRSWSRAHTSSAPSRSIRTGGLCASTRKSLTRLRSPDAPAGTLASMGNYIFDTEVLIEELRPRCC